jgi:hypothetical protein
MNKWIKNGLIGAVTAACAVSLAQGAVIFRDDFNGSTLQPGWVTSLAGGGVAQGTATVASGELYFSKDINYGGGHAHLWNTNVVLNPTQIEGYYRITYFGVHYPEGFSGDNHVQLGSTNNLAAFTGPGWRMTYGTARSPVLWPNDGVPSTVILGGFSATQTQRVDMAIEWGYGGTPGSGFVRWLTNGVVFASTNADYFDGKVLHIANEVGGIPGASIIIDAVQVEILVPEPSLLGCLLMGGLVLGNLRRFISGHRSKT